MMAQGVKPPPKWPGSQFTESFLGSPPAPCHWEGSGSQPGTLGPVTHMEEQNRAPGWPRPSASPSLPLKETSLFLFLSQ